MSAEEDGVSDAQFREMSDYIGAYCDRAEQDGIESLTHPQQVVVRFVAGKGIIDNGGFRYFYEGATWAADLADAFDELGLPRQAEATRRSMTVFPNGVPDDYEEACAWVEQNGEKADAIWDAASEVIWDIGLTGDVPILARYMKAHPEDFPGAPQFP